MYNRYTISQEMLVVGAKSNIGPITEKYVTLIREAYKKDKIIPVSLFTDFAKELKVETGINYEFTVSGDSGLDAGVSLEMMALGHSGTWYNAHKWLRAENSYNDPRKLETIIDVKNVRVKGGLADELKFKMYISLGFISEKLGFTIREVTAALVHEIGHTFNVFMYMGDYVWLNYYLTDGIEILQGKKNNVFKLEVLTDKWLKENLKEEEYQAYINDRSDIGNVRRAILSAYKKAPRHHLMNNPVTAMRREEQMADMFASRLGYGRDLATCLHKFDKYYGMEYQESGYIMLIIHALAMLWFSPLVMLVILTNSEVDEFNFSARYDDPRERIMKVRRDLIAQLRRTDTVKDKASMSDDVKAIDDIIRDFSNNRNLFDTVLEFFRPARRKETQYKQTEENLETLLNNDLFLQAFRLTQ